jgi:hypothetical protein
VVWNSPRPSRLTKLAIKDRSVKEGRLTLTSVDNRRDIPLRTGNSPVPNQSQEENDKNLPNVSNSTHTVTTTGVCCGEMELIAF